MNRYFCTTGISIFLGLFLFYPAQSRGAAKPSITGEPQNQNVIAGSNAVFVVSADGQLPLNYQWRFNGAKVTDNSHIDGATNSTLTISNLFVSDSGNYDVVITNDYGSITSSVAILTVSEPPTFNVQPVGRSVVSGLPASFTPSVNGTMPLSFQWQLNGTNILNATNLTYSIASVSSNDFGIYNLVVSNAGGIAISDDAPLNRGQIAVWGDTSAGQNLVPVNATNVVMICSGSAAALIASHSLALLADGTVIGWGNNTFGEASPPASLSNVVSIACGQDHSVALLANGTVFCWGSNAFGQTNVPSGLSNVIAIAAGSSHSLALRSDGKVFAWGLNASGQTTVPATLNKVVAISTGANHSLAIQNDGTVVAWGKNLDSRQFPPGPFPVPSGLINVSAIAGGTAHNIALLSNQTVFVWGSTNSGLQIIPTNLGPATAVAASADYNMALRNDGTVKSWGFGASGETNVPTALSNVIAIAAGNTHSVALVDDGNPVILKQPVGGTTFVGREYLFKTTISGHSPLTLQWQFNGIDITGATNSTLTLSNLSLTNAGNYQLIASNALGVATSVSVPLTVLDSPTLSFLRQLPSIQTHYQGAKVVFNLGVAGNGPLKYQWKFNGTNIVGATNEDLVFDPILLTNTGSFQVIVSNSFMSVSSSISLERVLLVKSFGYFATDPPQPLTNAIALAVGYFGQETSLGHYLALGSDGKITTWGSSYYGETNPPASLTDSIVTAISAGFGSSMALRSDGIPVTWGYPAGGITNVPAAANNIVAIASGDYHELALRSDGTVVQWGDSPIVNLPPPPASATNVIAISGGTQHSLAVRSDGTVVAWGLNEGGQTNVPLAATNVIAVAAGANHSLALRADGTVLQWGNGIAKYPVPTGATNVVAISASASHNIALRSDGSIVFWGSYYNPAVPPAFDLANVIQIASHSDHDLAMFGTRAPFITIQPYNRNLYRGSNTVFAAKAAGAQPMFYQWQFNGTNIGGATNDTLSLTNLQFGQSGSYQLVVSNSYGVTTSKGGKLQVTPPLGDSLDTTTTGVTWTSSGSAQWLGQTNVTHDGIDAAQSGSIGDNQESILETTAKSGGPTPQIAFWWKVSSEAGFDALEFRINGTVQAKISGEVDWERRVFPLPTNGLPVLQWRYYKNSNSKGGQDSAWIDQVSFVPSAPTLLAQPVSQTAYVGSNVSLSVGAAGIGLVYQWKQNQTNPVGGNSSILTLNNVGRAQNGTYSVTVTNAGGSATSSNAVLKVLVPQQIGAPTLLPDGSFQFISGDFDGGQLSQSDLANFELQASQDLLTWQTLSNSLTLTNGTLYFHDAGQTNFPARYYRILEH